MEKKKKAFLHWRIYVLVFSFSLAFFVIALRLFNLQVLAHERYSVLAEKQYSNKIILSPVRGEIRTADNFPLATNVDAFLVYGVPPEIKDADNIADKLCKIKKIEDYFTFEKVFKSRNK